MSDEIRPEDEVEGHSLYEKPGQEGPGFEGPVVDATEDDEPEVEGHGLVEGLVEKPGQYGPGYEGPTQE
jgi:hypothetical protein